MKQKDIKVGGLYRNSGSGITIREVLAIMGNHRPTSVLYKQEGWKYTIHLKSFAKWAESEVTNDR